VQRILLRTALFLVPASAQWALLPLIATSRLGLGSGGYGVLLGALGAGAIGGALIVPRARARLSANALAAVASLAYAAALAAVALSRNLGLTIVVLLPTAVAAGAATLWFWPFHQIADMDRSPVRWPEPRLPMSAGRDSGLVLVRTTYTIAADKEQRFLQAMARLRQSRLRTGAIDWALYQDSQNPCLFIELYGVPSWEEHLRQHRDRQTGTDLQYRDDAAALSDPQPRVGHYLARDVRE
jgi:hypothetical protein